MKIAVVTAIFGGIDTFKEVPNQTLKDVDFFYFDEQNNTLGLQSGSDRLLAKYYKVCAHKIMPEYDIFIWIDGNMEVTSDKTIQYLIDELSDNDLLIQKHWIDCIYDDASDMLSSMKDSKSATNEYLTKRFTVEEIEKQIDAYGSKIKPHDGYWLGGLFARRNNKCANDFFDQWWKEIQSYGLRDQFSFAYLMHTTKNLKTKEIPSIIGGEMIKYHQHLKIQ